MEVKYIKEKKELEDAFHIRKVVFVDEQSVPLEDEFDEHDAIADHILVYYQDQPVGTGRLRVADNVAKLERICVLAPYRKYGVGRVVVEALEKLAKDKGLVKAKLHGQTQAARFYENLGYRVASDEFMEDGIPHYLMIKELL